MIADLREIADALEKLSRDIDVQLAASSSDANQFHENLINLLADFPNDKELIQFVVYINDRLETNQTISKDIFMDSLKGIIKQKLILVKRLIKEQEIELDKLNNKNNKLQKIFQFVSENKLTIIIVSLSLSSIFIFGSLYLKPNETMETLKLIDSARKGGK